MGRMRWLGLIVIGLLIVTMNIYAQTPAQPEEATPTSTEEVGTEEPTEEAVPTSSSEDGEGCPVLVQEALDVTKTTCESLANNEVCYGHSTLDAASRPGFTDFKFDEPGDIEEIIELQSLSLSPMDLDREEWGVILMRVRAAPVQSDQSLQPLEPSEIASRTQEPVTFVVFGDTELTAPTTILEARTTGSVNLRELPTTTSDIVAVLAQDSAVILNGRTTDGDWLRVRIITNEGGVNLGWVAADLVALEADAEFTSLDEVTDADLSEASPLNYGPMQAFYFRSGGDDAPCEAAPNSGMLIQTPEGQASVTLWIDEVIIELSGTTYVQTGDDGKLTLNALDGTVSVTAAGDTRTAVSGVQVTVPLTEDLLAADVPDAPQPIDLSSLQALPVELLDEAVAIPNPLSVPEGAPAPGGWAFRWDIAEAACPSGDLFTFEASGIPQGMTVAADGSSIVWGNNRYNRISQGVYQTTFADDEGNLHQDTLNVSALDRIQGEAVIDIVSQITPCTLTVPFSLTLVSAS